MSSKICTGINSITSYFQYVIKVKIPIFGSKTNFLLVVIVFQDIFHGDLFIEELTLESTVGLELDVVNSLLIAFAINH